MPARGWTERTRVWIHCRTGTVRAPIVLTPPHSRTHLASPRQGGACSRLTLIGRSVMTSVSCLAKKDLSHVNLAMADLHGADLHAAILRHATLTETNLEAADLTEADLTDANLGGACLRNATAAHANMEGADLRDTDLSGTNLRGARLVGAKLRANQRASAASAGAELDEEKSEDTSIYEN